MTLSNALSRQSFSITDPMEKMLKELVDLYQSGRIILLKIQVRPLEEAMDAHLESEGGYTYGKVVLRVS